MFQRFPVARICRVDIDLGEFAQVRQRDCRSCINKPASRGNHEHATRPIPDPGEHIRVSDFAAEVESAQESEDFGDRRALFAAESSGEIEPGAVAQQHPGAPPAGVSGRKQKDALAGLFFHHAQRFRLPLLAQVAGRNPGARLAFRR